MSAPGSTQPARAVLPVSVAKRRRPHGDHDALLVRGTTIDRSAEDAIDEGVAGLEENASLYVERGYQDDSTRIILLLLGGVGGVLVLGGTLTATFLALSDARPDFATMGAVGAARGPGGRSPRRTPARSGWSAPCWVPPSGFVPGIAVTFPLTGSSLGRAGRHHHRGRAAARPLPRRALAPGARPGGRPAAGHRCRRRAGVAVAAADGQPAVVIDVRREQRATRRRILPC